MFAGSKSLKEAGIGVATPMEAYPSKGVYIAAHDISRPEVILALEYNIKAGCFCYIHFGLPCTSWSSMQMMNRGSRRSWIPRGDGTHPKEIEANEMAVAISRLCWLQLRTGGLFSIENPRTSHVWRYPAVEALLGVA